MGIICKHCKTYNGTIPKVPLVCEECGYELITLTQKTEKCQCGHQYKSKEPNQTPDIICPKCGIKK